MSSTSACIISLLPHQLRRPVILISITGLSMYADFYAALQDEVQRLNKAIHYGLAPSIYRFGVTYIVEYAEIESNRIWFSVIRLEWNQINAHIYTPYVEEAEFFCYGQWEWSHLLAQSGIKRNVYFTLWKR